MQTFLKIQLLFHLIWLYNMYTSSSLKQKDKPGFMDDIKYFLDTQATVKRFLKLTGINRYKYTV